MTRPDPIDWICIVIVLMVGFGAWNNFQTDRNLAALERTHVIDGTSIP